MVVMFLASVSLSTLETYRFLNKSKSFLSEHTYKTMRMLINALLIETISITMLIAFPFGLAFLYEKFDTSLTAAALKKICYTITSIVPLISDTIKLICVKNYRFDELKLWIRGDHPRVKNRNKIFLKFLKNDIFRGNFMRKIDCAHSRSVKTFVWPRIEKYVFLPIFSHLLTLNLFFSNFFNFSEFFRFF